MSPYDETQAASVPEPRQPLVGNSALQETCSLVGTSTESFATASRGVPAVSGQRFASYELIEEVARGGMGIVFKARQLGLNRIVAIKMLLSGEQADEPEIKRFQAEAEAAAKLDHPRIVPIFEVGEYGGRQFFSMAYVEGQSLAKRLTEGPMPPCEAAELLLKIADAVEYAHQQGIIHRDLKPGNILLDNTGEPRVTDFGLAKQIRRDSDLTATGQVLGTPSFMPPEQALGRLDQIDPTSDIYALGAILYAQLTGQPPFRASSLPETLRQVVEQDPVSPRQLNHEVPRDLETICLKCLQKDSGRRYHSAQMLVADLGCFLAGKPISARPITRVERLAKLSRRHPIAAALLLLLGIALISIMMGAPIAVVRERRLRQLADRERQVAVHERDLAQRGAYNVQLAHVQAILDSNPIEAKRLLDDASTCPPRFRDFTWRLLSDRTSRDRLDFAGHSGKVVDFASAPDGTLLASCDETGEIRLWDARNGRCKCAIAGQSGQTVSLAFSPTGAILACGGEDHCLTLRNVESLTEIATLKTPHPTISHVAFSPSGTLIAAISYMSRTEPNAQTAIATLWDVATKDEVGTIPACSAAGLAFSADDELLFLVSSDEFTPEAWHISTGTKRQSFDPQIAGITPSKSYSNPAIDLAISPSGKLLAVAYYGSGLVCWDVHTREVAFKSDDLVASVAFSPDGRKLAIGGGSLNGPRELLIRDTSSGARTVSFSTEVDPAVGKVVFSRTDERVATMSDHLIWQWSAQSLPIMNALPGHNGSIQDLEFSADGQYLASCAAGEDTSDDIDASNAKPGDIKVWTVRTGTLKATLEGHKKAVSDVCFLSGNSQLASTSGDGTIKIWDLKAEREIATLTHDGFADKLWQIEGTRILVSSGWTGAVGWDLQTQHPRLIYKGLTVSQSPDGRFAIERPHRESVLNLWDLESYQKVSQIPIARNENWDMAFAFSPKSRFIAISKWAKSSGMVSIWEVSSGGDRPLLRRRDDESRSECFFTATGLLAVIAMRGHSAGVSYFKPETGQQVEEAELSAEQTDLLRPSLRMRSIAPDGRTRIIADRDAIKLIDPYVGHVRLTMPTSIQKSATTLAVFSPDGKAAACAGWGKGDPIFLMSHRSK